MARALTNVAVLGSTGSIGVSTLEVIAALPERLRVVALSAHSNLRLALQQARQFRPRWLVAADEEQSRGFDWSDLPSETELLSGAKGLDHIAGSDEVDVVVAAIVGSAGLASTWAAIEAGKRIALANKETLVMAGPLVTEAARRHGATILPVDSEHSAVFQTLAAGQAGEIERIVLTASGGPFLDHTAEQLARVTAEEALEHPTWEMGAKITVDSATMMNKALEVIEARWLFDLPPEKIEVVIHPQSVVHSLVEFNDGSVIAQLSPPDMRLPIQYALTYPERCPGPAARIDWQQAQRLDFQPPDFERFPALLLGWEAARLGGTAGAVLNAANEAAVEGFLGGRLGYNDIAVICRQLMENHDFDSQPTLQRLVELDSWARQEVNRRALGAV